MRFTAKLLLTGITLLSVVGCGGGGGGDSNAGSGGPVSLACAVAAGGSFSLSGDILLENSSFLDSDTLVNGQPVVDNGSFASAQLIPNPVKLGGYADRDRDELVDTNDFYAVELAAGDQVTLLVGDSSSDDDLDLFLYDSAQALVDLSTNFYNPGGSLPTLDENLGLLERVTAPVAGLYYVEVRVWAGGSGYSLRVDGGTGAAEAAMTPLMEEFVPGEVLLKYHESSAGSLPLAATASAAGDLEYLAGAAERTMRMRMLPRVVASAAPGATTEQMRFRTDTERRKYETLQLIKALRHDPAVEYASPNYILRPARLPNDSLFTNQWSLQPSAEVAGGINLPAAWDITTGDPSVVVAVIDTGIRTDHPDLKDKLVNGYDFVSDLELAADGDLIDDDPFDPSDPDTSVFHGTHVAGTVGADTDNEGLGVAGVAWDAKIMPLRAMGENEGTFYDIMQAMLYAAGLPNDSGVELRGEERADIINLSLGSLLNAPDRLQQEVVDRVRAEGIIVVAAAGNRASSASFYPASYEGVISVSATGREAEIAQYSSFGPTVDVAAPGGDGSFGIISTWGPEGYSVLRGTSMASPHVAGVIALMQSARINNGWPALTPEQVDFLLAKGDISNGGLAKDLGSAGRDDLYGYGLIDAAAAVQAALRDPDPQPTPILLVSPGAVDFGVNTNVAALNIRNSGGGLLEVTVSSPAADTWLTIEPEDNVTPAGLGIYQLRVDRTGLTQGNYLSEVTVTPANPNPPNVGKYRIAVAMVVSDQPFEGDVGEITVFLIDPAEPEVILGSVDNPGDPANPVTLDGPGPYSFMALPAGCYKVLASTDIDADRFIGEVGEAWGKWSGSINGEPASDVLLLDQDATDIDLDVFFD